jgi:hypothetical protein
MYTSWPHVGQFFLEMLGAAVVMAGSIPTRVVAVTVVVVVVDIIKA